MAAAENLKQLTRYGRVARNCQMLLVMEPQDPIPSVVEEARGAIAREAADFLSEVQNGVESPYFTTYTLTDARFIDLIAAEKVRQSEWDRVGIFQMEPRLRMTDSSEAQAATFAYLAASCMRQVRTPFYQARALRASVTGPRDLSEFVKTVATVKDTTLRAAKAGEFHEVVQRIEWRVAFAFWEANRQLAWSMGGIA